MKLDKSLVASLGMHISGCLPTWLRLLPGVWVFGGVEGRIIVLGANPKSQPLVLGYFEEQDILSANLLEDHLIMWADNGDIGSTRKFAIAHIINPKFLEQCIKFSAAGEEKSGDFIGLMEFARVMKSVSPLDFLHFIHNSQVLGRAAQVHFLFGGSPNKDLNEFRKSCIESWLKIQKDFALPFIEHGLNGSGNAISFKLAHFPIKSSILPAASLALTHKWAVIVDLEASSVDFHLPDKPDITFEKLF